MLQDARQPAVHPALYTDPALLGFTNPFFTDAPVGEIFAAGAEDLKPQYLGTKNRPVRDAVENACAGRERQADSERRAGSGLKAAEKAAE